MNPQALVLAAFLIALCALLALDHRNGQKRVDEALARANAERADKMLAFKAIDDAFKLIAQPMPADLPRRIPGQRYAQRDRGAA